MAGGATVRGLGTWPTIDAQPGAEVVLNNTLLVVPNGNCTPASVQQRTVSLWSAVGTGVVGVMPDNVTTYVQGTQAMSLPVVSLNGGQALGTMRLVNLGAAMRCLQDVEYNSTAPRTGHAQDDSGGGGGPPWWVWLLVALASATAVALALVGASYWLASRRRRRYPSEAALKRASSEPPSTGKTDELEKGEAAAPIYPERFIAGESAHQLSAVASAMRVRFGDLGQSLELGELIGKGGYGRVYKARWKGAQAAVKVIQHSTPSFPSMSNAGSPSSSPTLPAPNLESLLGTTLSHPNIVATYRVSTVFLRRSPSSDPAMSDLTSLPTLGTAASDEPAAVAAPGPAGFAHGKLITGGSMGGPGKLSDQPADSASSGQLQGSSRRLADLCETWLVMEYCDRGSLSDAVRGRKFVDRSSSQPHMRPILMCLLDVARGMQYLHANKVIHGDLKPANVLLKSRDDGSKGFSCKIADLGLSRLLDPQQSQRLTQSCGTIGYMPPEVLTAGRLTTACDVYSFGILMWELTTCHYAFADESAAQVFYRVVQLGERPTAPPGIDFPQGYLVLMQKCWDADPSARPAFTDLVTEIQTLLASECR
ncbi:hypothetical protein N2152v2_006728 [Parachlorella kessleri]